jgi:lipopolysaccharide heptosyltransferase II
MSIDWLVRKRCADLLLGNTDLDMVHVVPNRPSLSDLMDIRHKLYGRKYDAAFDMQGLFLSGLLTYLSGAPIRVGLDRNREMNFLFLTMPVVAGKDTSRHAVDILGGFAALLGAEMPTSANAANYLALPSCPAIEHLPRPRIAVNPGASTPYKQWPLSHWHALCGKLQESGFSLVIVGGPKEAEAGSDLAAAFGSHTVNLAGKTTLAELANTLAHCDLMVSADTGPLHVAAAVGTRVVALFGCTDPVRTGPYGKEHVALRELIACSPCFRNPTCNGAVDCMRLLDPDRVYKEIAAILRAKIAQ